MPSHIMCGRCAAVHLGMHKLIMYMKSISLMLLCVILRVFFFRHLLAILSAVDGRTSLFIEEPVSSFHSSTVSVPSISALGARLKQRPVQDPLADSKPMSKLLASSFTSK